MAASESSGALDPERIGPGRFETPVEKQIRRWIPIWSMLQCSSPLVSRCRAKVLGREG